MRREDHPAPISTLPLFAEAARARKKDPETSHDAARQATRLLRESQGAVLRVFHARGPLSDEQLLLHYEYLRTHSLQHRDLPRQSPSGLRTRRHELVLLGSLVYSGRRDERAAGKVKPRIWRLAAEAKRA